MASDCGGRKPYTTDDFIKTVLQGMTMANAWLGNLEAALDTGDLKRAIVSAAKLHNAWVHVESTIAKLGELALSKAASPRELWHYEVANNALLAGRYFARETLTRMWTMLEDGIVMNDAHAAINVPEQHVGSTRPSLSLVQPIIATNED
jgi:hypothetical protein